MAGSGRTSAEFDLAAAQQALAAQPFSRLVQEGAESVCAVAQGTAMPLNGPAGGGGEG
ncbi:MULTISPECIES: hypothetical protein [unclassified Streptomyces]|nr:MULTISPECIES: hypothetical protein [unclassified Streptomyces]MYX07364.1 hypothetical protein [Streptomyces sp. SID8375]